MVRYFYVWTPLLIIGTMGILSLPWLGLIALMIVSLVALPAFALGSSRPYLLGRTITRRWHGRREAVRRVAPALSVNGHPHPAFEAEQCHDTITTQRRRPRVCNLEPATSRLWLLRATLSLFPNRRDGFFGRARGHVLDLADPDGGHALAPISGQPVQRCSMPATAGTRASSAHSDARRLETRTRQPPPHTRRGDHETGLRSSPQIRRCPQRGFSRANRSTSSRISGDSGGRQWPDCAPARAPVARLIGSRRGRSWRLRQRTQSSSRHAPDVPVWAET